MENDSGVVARAMLLQQFFLCSDRKTLGIVEARQREAKLCCLIIVLGCFSGFMLSREMIGLTPTYLNANFA